MRILYFSDNCSDHNRRFLEKFSSFGHEVFFLDVTQESSAENSLLGGVRRVTTQKKIHRDANPGQFAEFLSEFRFLLKQIQPDLVHAGPIQTCGYVAALSGFHPMVVMSWGSDLLVHANRNTEWMRATEIALGAADGFCCDCETVGRAARRWVVFPHERIVQLPWGIKRRSFSPQGVAEPRDKLGLGSEAFAFISTRSWEPLYDIETLLQAFAAAYRKNNQLRLFLLGNGSEARRVRALIDEHGLEQAVITPGLIAREDMPRWFRAANAYVSCAKSDGTSISLLEAMATGLPAVVTDIASNREWIAEDENGWLAAAGSSEEFAAKLLRAASIPPNDLEAISQRNRTIVAARADWDKNFPSLLRLFEYLTNSAMAMKA